MGVSGREAHKDLGKRVPGRACLSPLPAPCDLFPVLEIPHPRPSGSPGRSVLCELILDLRAAICFELLTLHPVGAGRAPHRAGISHRSDASPPVSAPGEACPGPQQGRPVLWALAVLRACLPQHFSRGFTAAHVSLRSPKAETVCVSSSPAAPGPCLLPDRCS